MTAKKPTKSFPKKFVVLDFQSPNSFFQPDFDEKIQLISTEINASHCSWKNQSHIEEARATLKEFLQIIAKDDDNSKLNTATLTRVCDVSIFKYKQMHGIKFKFTSDFQPGDANIYCNSCRLEKVEQKML